MFRSTPMSRLLEKDWKDTDQTINKITSGKTSRKGRRQVNKGEIITFDACILCFSFLKATMSHLILLKVYHKPEVYGSSVQSRWKDIYDIIHVSTESPVQVRCTILDAWGWCTGTTQRDGMGRQEGGGFRMGNMCIPVVDSCWYMEKPIQYCKVKKNKI